MSRASSFIQRTGLLVLPPLVYAACLGLRPRLRVAEFWFPDSLRLPWLTGYPVQLLGH